MEDALDAKKEQLSATKRALLGAWLTDAEADLATTEHDAASDDTKRYEAFPLTEMQEAYWLGRHRAFELGAPSLSYIEIDVPELDVGRLELALERLVQRHDMLRAVIQADGRQRVLATTPPIEIDLHRLQGLPPEQQEVRLHAIRREMTRGIEHPDRWPLFAVGVSLLDNRTLLHVMFDILVVDMQSVRVLTRDLGLFYRDPTASIPPIRSSFRNLVLAREARKSSPSYARAKRYWLDRLDTLPPPPPLPLACSPRELPDRRFYRHASRLESGKWDEIKRRAAALKLTPTAPLLAAFAQVLARRSAISRFTLNVTMYNRPPDVEQIDEVVGDFTSLTLVECDLSPIESFGERASRLQRQLWADLDHRDYDGVEVLRERMRRLRTRSAGMPIVFTSNLLHDRGNVSAGGQAPLGQVVTAITQTPQVWIDHQAAEHDGALVFSWDVLDALFPPRIIEEMLAEYQERIESLCNGDAWSAVEALSTVCSALPSRVEPPTAPVHEPPVVRASDHVLARVLARIGEVLGDRQVVPDAPVIDLGLTSIGIVRLANALEVDLRVRPGIDALFDCPTPAAIASMYDALIDKPEAAVVSEMRDGGLILDPAERSKFTEAEHGRRRDLDGAPCTFLAPPKTSVITMDWAQRRTHRTFSLKRVALDSLGGLLAAFRRRTEAERPLYLYPSAGGLYPVQVYLHAKEGRVEGLSGGYYYDPTQHALRQTSPGLKLERKLHGWNNRAVFDQSAFSLFLVVDERAIQPLYGRLAQEFALIEAGAMLELAMLVGVGLGIGLCPVGRFDASELRGAFAWHGDHALVHTMIGGAVMTGSTGDSTEDLLRDVVGLSDAEVDELLARRETS